MKGKRVPNMAELRQLHGPMRRRSKRLIDKKGVGFTRSGQRYALQDRNAGGSARDRLSEGSTEGKNETRELRDAHRKLMRELTGAQSRTAEKDEEKNKVILDGEGQCERLSLIHI